MPLARVYQILIYIHGLMLTTMMWFRGRSGIARVITWMVGGLVVSVYIRLSTVRPLFADPKPTQTRAFFLFTIASKHYNSIQKTKKMITVVKIILEHNSIHQHISEWSEWLDLHKIHYILKSQNNHFKIRGRSCNFAYLWGNILQWQFCV